MAFYNSVISGNTISNNGEQEFQEFSAGIQIVESVYNVTVSSNNNTIVENVIRNNFNGISAVRYSEDNLFSHNTFENNTNHVLIFSPSYMSSNRVGENYWSGYGGEDIDGDGFGDTPYLLDAQSRDNRPLMSPFSYWSNPIKEDVDKNTRVDIRDIAIAAKAFGSYPSHPRWKPNADINGDYKVDIKDVALIAKNFGRT
jgi:parallel beta-helix repeat protein